MYKTSQYLEDEYNTDEQVYELIIKGAYAIFIYAIIAYKTEVRTKESFLGRESFPQVVENL